MIKPSKQQRARRHSTLDWSATPGDEVSAEQLQRQREYLAELKQAIESYRGY